MNLVIFGSRTLTGNKITRIIDKHVKNVRPDMVLTSGETEGVCRVAREYCAANKMTLKLHFLNEKKAAGKYHHRSLEILKQADWALFIHDGKSKGTANEIKLAEKLKVEHTIVTTRPAKQEDEDVEGFGDVE